MATIEILSTGVGLSIQDGGRFGWRQFGVPSGGAMDRYSAEAANRLLGNRANAPVLEVLMQGAKLRVLEDTWIALAGADLGCPLSPWTASEVKAGTVLHFPVNRSGLWAYIAVPGGFEADHWFGSASVDARNGLGESLKTGSQLSAVLREPNASVERVGRRVLLPELQKVFPSSAEFEVLPGPQFDLFEPEARAQLVASEWTVSARSDRTGYRLDGPELSVPESIRSEPVLPGSFQIPGNGQPIVTMTDGPTVGGYAKLAILREADLGRLAQCRPGTKVTFIWA
ncbi:MULTISPECIES: biotin-dependent carboxyltransferase family protein [unclassified Lentimonas]|uniref:5-oxoprolinase subunit C family protein n=1 Tax=unclassified Lentimonas TaxID=2630993 RepID=UPI0013280367|nr:MULTISPECIES: biotin-dependent carboxyltransferase family protein [unclassified Lentimonas]CAA6696417.1 Allophanate hydrolase 2 subunit 2 (EC [Lentimonas sp. CC10]CAA6697671.1 Allophanate hydrolase 2 subunit 2 (EC [Lentimonas sp. CC19]CAA7071490.1 Allophanate hydrolase 2 subunit 2 (EC [Lentimonas sp. CC11]